MAQNFNPKTIKVFIGLGNPDTEHANTYHNVGALYLDHLREIIPETFTKQERKKLFTYIKWGRLRLVWPLTYMNESGMAVAAAMRYLNSTPRRLLLIHDDSDLMLGAYKLSIDRGAAGHKGVNSVIAALNTKKFWRLRIGIRQREIAPRIKALDFVLKKISPDAQDILDATFRDIDTKLFPLQESR